MNTWDACDALKLLFRQAFFHILAGKEECNLRGRSMITITILAVLKHLEKKSITSSPTDFQFKRVQAMITITILAVLKHLEKKSITSSPTDFQFKRVQAVIFH
ncbi:hypothetical protein L484_012186 [Morus notabilis]|uniref:Uncharacterized protein n=1 Tax=Morus notabilis TaxID=981085 RepID=W9R8K2_9ROSA|nr:hypothetical protein L484_012186 [Morus notabilis]